MILRKIEKFLIAAINSEQFDAEYKARAWQLLQDMAQVQIDSKAAAKTWCGQGIGDGCPHPSECLRQGKCIL